MSHSKSQKALKPELYLAHVDLATAEFKSSEKCPLAFTGCVYPMALPASGRDWSRNRLMPAYLFRLVSVRMDHTEFLPLKLEAEIGKARQYELGMIMKMAWVEWLMGGWGSGRRH